MARKPKTAEEAEAFRTRLIAAAVPLFAQKGAAHVSMREIAETVGVSAMTPYLYFPDKDAIFAAVRIAALTRFSDALRNAVQDKDPLDASRAVSRAYVDFALGEPGMYRLLFDHDVAAGEAGSELAEASRKARETLTHYVRPLVDAGILSGDPEMIGALFWASVHGTLVLQRSGALGNIDGDTLRRILVRAIFRGLRIAG